MSRSLNRRFPDASSSRPGPGSVDMLGRPTGGGGAAGGARGDGTLGDVLAVLRRRALIVALSVLLVPVAAAAYSLTSDSRYEATATLLFRDPAIDEQLFGTTFFAPPDDPARAAATNESLVALDNVAERTAAALPPEMRGAVEDVEVMGEGEADLVSITATTGSPAAAARVANTWAEEYIAFRREADREKIEQARALIEEQLASLPPEQQGSQRATVLAERASQLETLAALQTGNAELVERARPPVSAASPRPKRNIALGLVLGAVLGVGLAMLLDRLDRRLRDPDEVEELFGLPVLGRIPRSRAVAQAVSSRNGVGMASGRETEAFRLLRANLRYFHVEERVASVLITSAASGEGKTTVAWNLAAAAAATGERALLIEADLRKPALTGSPAFSGKGLSLVLADLARADEAIVSTPASRSEPGAVLDVLPAGPVPPNPIELLHSGRMESLLGWAEEEYDLVVVDSSPILLVADAIPLARQATGVVVVSRIGGSDRRGSVALRDELRNLEAPVLGVVLNAHPLRSGYGYGYGYYQGTERDRA